MHIVHVTHRAWPAIGGSERHVQEIARRQLLDGHSVTILATDADDLSALWDRRGRRFGPGIPDSYQGVRIRRLAVRHLPLGALAFPALRRVVWLLSHFSVRATLPMIRFTPWVPSLRQALVEESADLLFAWNITLESLTARVHSEAERRGVPWVAVPILHLGRPRFYTMRHQLELLRAARAVLAETFSERAFLIRHGFAPDQVHVVSPWIDPAEGRQADGERFRRRHGVDGPLVLTLGTLCYDKGTHDVLGAAQRLWNDGRRLTVALLGVQHESVRRDLLRLPERHRACCRYPGRVSEEDKWDALDAADVVVLPSRTESFGIVFIEAWSLGKPVVGAAAGAVPDVISDGVDGLLVEFGDVGGLASALGTLLGNAELAVNMGQRGREKVLREYTCERQYGRLQTLVDQLVRERKDEHTWRE